MTASVRPARHDVDPGAWLVTTAQAAAAAGVPIGTIWSWASRRRQLIRPVGYVGREPRYDLADVLRTELATRRTPRANRLLAVTDSGMQA